MFCGRDFVRQCTFIHIFCLRIVKWFCQVILDAVSLVKRILSPSCFIGFVLNKSFSCRYGMVRQKIVWVCVAVVLLDADLLM